MLCTKSYFIQSISSEDVTDFKGLKKIVYDNIFFQGRTTSFWDRQVKGQTNRGSKQHENL